jgi:hypothetical protein
MILDLLYFYENFIDTLPETYKEFVFKINEVFPYIIDTKVLAKNL